MKPPGKKPEGPTGAKQSRAGDGKRKPAAGGGKYLPLFRRFKALYRDFRLSGTLLRLGRAFDTALFPPRCLVCGAFFRKTIADGGPEEDEEPGLKALLGCPDRARFSILLAPSLCRGCREDFSPLVPPLCTRCSKPFPATEGEDHLCGRCIGKPARLRTIRSAGVYEGALMAVIHLLKYREKVQLAPPLGRLLFLAFLTHFERGNSVEQAGAEGEALAAGGAYASVGSGSESSVGGGSESSVGGGSESSVGSGPESSVGGGAEFSVDGRGELSADGGGIDLVIPVPLHRRKHRQRGFNQAWLLVRHWPRYMTSLGKGGSAPAVEPSVLVRRRWTESQTGFKKAERLRNVRNAFSLESGAQLKGKRVLLVDDVYTTGATAEECASVLLAGGAASVDLLTLARSS